MKSDRSAALALMAAAIAGLVLANSPIGGSLLDFKNLYIGIESWGLKLSLEHWVSDLLLAVFFLVAGLELKYELRSGVLSKPSTAMVPVIAAIGGVIVPALIYVAFNFGTDGLRGWPIPTATDIAFALGVLAIFGRGLPKQARIFLLALAIFDDLVAILIIAVFFTTDLEPTWLFAAMVVAVLHFFLEKIKPLPMNLVRAASFLVLWYCVLQSGVHPTIAGVLLGLIIPARQAHGLVEKIQPWTNTIVLPLFAFFAVAIAIPSFEGSSSNVFLGILVALPVGKIVGITLFALIANSLASRDARMELKAPDFLAVAALAGVGFTVSLLMAKLAFGDHPELAAEATLAVILGSVISMVIGAAIAQSRARHYRKLQAQ
ncbi:MAG: Na+/H+ antiporter NhaA [Actinomycetota bacterium]|nr:Na+/H+ antiporter NhaA [Actinomycetota bacterium]